MFKILSLPDNKGSVYSPFIIAALVLITFSVSAYLIETQDAGEDRTFAVGRIRKATLDMEGVRTEAGTMAALSLRDAFSSAGNKTDAELEDEIGADMDLRVRSMDDLSSLVGNYSFSLKNLSGGRLLLRSQAAPTACVGDRGVVVCGKLSIEEVFYRTWIS